MKTSTVVPIQGTETQSRTNPPQRILVVDDNSEIRHLNAEVLKQSGYEVETAEDGEAGWKALRAVSYVPDTFDLLITDHDMPGLTGLELVRRLRAARVELPVIMATGTLPEEAFTGHVWLQPTATLLKPYSVEELLGTVREVLRAPDNPREQTAPTPGWRRHAPAEGS